MWLRFTYNDPPGMRQVQVEELARTCAEDLTAWMETLFEMQTETAPQSDS
jgi:hypothetical protein